MIDDVVANTRATYKLPALDGKRAPQTLITSRETTTGTNAPIAIFKVEHGLLYAFTVVASV